MNAIRDRADAAALPTRHHFALVRLVAMMQFARMPPQRRAGLVMPIDEYQTAFENHGMSLLVWLLTTAFVADALSQVILFAVALLVAALIAPLLLVMTVAISSIVASALRVRDHVQVNSAFVMILLIAGSAYYATGASWPRWPARLFLALTIANVAAAPVAWLLRHRMAAMEQRCAS